MNSSDEKDKTKPREGFETWNMVEDSLRGVFLYLREGFFSLISRVAYEKMRKLDERISDIR